MAAPASRSPKRAPRRRRSRPAPCSRRCPIRCWCSTAATGCAMPTPRPSSSSTPAPRRLHRRVARRSPAGGQPALRARRTPSAAPATASPNTASRLETPRLGTRVVTIQAAPLAEERERVVVTLQERSIADKIDRQLTHRNAARSVTAMAAMLAHEVKNPLSGIRGAAQLLEENAGAADRELTRLICDEADRICALVDRMEVFSDRRPIERDAGQHPRGAGARAQARAQSGFARHVRFVEEYDPSLPPVARQSRPADPGVPEPGEERRRGGAGAGRRDRAFDRLPARRAARGRRQRQPRASAAGGLGHRQRRGHSRGSPRRICSIPSSRPSTTAPASVSRWSPRSSATTAASSSSTASRAAPCSASILPTAPRGTDAGNDAARPSSSPTTTAPSARC